MTKWRIVMRKTDGHQVLLPNEYKTKKSAIEVLNEFFTYGYNDMWQDSIGRRYWIIKK